MISPRVFRAALKRLGLTERGARLLARGVAGKGIGGGVARVKLIRDGFAEELAENSRGAYLTRTTPTEKGRAAIAELRGLGW